MLWPGHIRRVNVFVFDIIQIIRLRPWPYEIVHVALISLVENGQFHRVNVWRQVCRNQPTNWPSDQPTYLSLDTSLLKHKKILLFIGFMVIDRLELMVSTQKSVLKNMHQSWDIKQNEPKIRSPNQTCTILDVLVNISGPGAYFLKPIFALKPWVQAGRFEYHKLCNRKNFVLDL